jgi:hypothetical protein
VRQFSVFCLAAGIAAALVGPASGGKAGLSGNLCTTVPKGALVALKVTAPCINQKPHVRPGAGSNSRRPDKRFPAIRADQYGIARLSG